MALVFPFPLPFFLLSPRPPPPIKSLVFLLEEGKKQQHWEIEMFPMLLESINLSFPKSIHKFFEVLSTFIIQIPPFAILKKGLPS